MPWEQELFRYRKSSNKRHLTSKIINKRLPLRGAFYYTVLFSSVFRGNPKFFQKIAFSLLLCQILFCSLFITIEIKRF